jgi:pimeloyl-ACP methyl ester carboxylesterase
MHVLSLGLVLQVAVLLGLSASQALAQTPPTPAGPLVLEKQGSFFVGGRDETSTTLGLAKSAPKPGTVTVDQVYVRYQTPPGAQARPNVVLIHGCCLTGKTWETTPDGRMGWDEYFVRRGFSTYVIDQAWRGRSASDPSAINAVADGLQPGSTLPAIFSSSHEASWVVFRFGPKFGETFPGLQFPVSAAGELWKQLVPDYAFGLPNPNPTVTALVELTKRAGPSILISHSQSGIYPFQGAALDGRNIAGIIAIEPAACPSATGDMTPYNRIPIMVLFGDNTSTSPIWAAILKSCRDYVDALGKAGGRAEMVVLPEIGIKGNSHMLMQDLNNLQIADLLATWIAKTGVPRQFGSRSLDRHLSESRTHDDPVE